MTSRKFSIAHWDSVTDSDIFLTAFENSSDEFKSSISDIYFGHAYEYEGGLYGDVMDTRAGDQQITNLFTIQEKYGIPISLTMNETIPDKEFLTNPVVQDGFIEYLRGFYDRGLRICTIGDTHLINSGRLHHEFPEMRWKNTVNHLVRDAQGVVDYAMLGYDTILINRNLHRDLPEVKRIKKAVTWFNENHPNRKPIETSLLVSEGCILNCPWKSVHDYHWKGSQYFKVVSNTCSSWRNNNNIPPDLPRNNPDAYWLNADTYFEFAKYVDTFKYVGRTSKYAPTENPIMGWVKNPFVHTTRKSHPSFDDVLENEIMVHQYTPGLMSDSHSSIHKLKDTIILKNNRTKTKSSRLDYKKLQTLDRVLRQCRGQCFNCHKCEEAYETNNLTSLIGVYK